MNFVQPFGQAAQHLRGTHCHVVGGFGAALRHNFFSFGSHQQLGHQVDNVPAGEVSTSLLVIGLGEFPNQFLKDITHVSGGDLLRRHISFGGIKLLQGHEQNTTLYHQLHGVGEVEVIDNVLDIGREALQIGFKVDFHIVRISDQLCKIVVAGIIEIIARDTAQDTVPGSALHVLGIQLLRHLYNGRFGGLQCVIKTLQHGHRQNHFAILMWLEQAHQMGGNLPD